MPRSASSCGTCPRSNRSTGGARMTHNRKHAATRRTSERPFQGDARRMPRTPWIGSALISGMRRLDDGVDAAAHEEIALDDQALGCEQRHEVVEDLVRDRFVEGTLVAVAPQVQLQALELDTAIGGRVADPDH